MDARQASHVLLPLVCKDMQSQFLDLFLVESRFIASLKSYQLHNLPADCARDQFKSWLGVSVSNPSFLEPETRFFWQFSTTRNPVFFQLPNLGTVNLN